VIAEPVSLDDDAFDLGQPRGALPLRVGARQARDDGRDDAELQRGYVLGSNARSAMMFFCTSVAPAPMVV
jgi:hypothetical protein